MSSNPMALIRVIDEEESARNSLKFLLEQEGWKVRLYFSIKEPLHKRWVICYN